MEVVAPPPPALPAGTLSIVPIPVDFPCVRVE